MLNVDWRHIPHAIRRIKKEITIIVTWPTSILQKYKQSGLKEENWSMVVSSNKCSGRGMEIRS
jgi:hypothetical protein